MTSRPSTSIDQVGGQDFGRIGVPVSPVPSDVTIQQNRILLAMLIVLCEAYQLSSPPRAYLQAADSLLELPT